MTSQDLQHYYRLRVNVSGFRLEDIKVELVEDLVTNGGAEKSERKIRVKITAKRDTVLKSAVKDKHDESKEFVKYFEIVPKYDQELGKFINQIDEPKSMKYYTDKKNASYLIVEFKSTAISEDVYVTLDDSVDSLMEAAARSLLNVRNLDDLKYTIQNPFTGLSSANNKNGGGPDSTEDMQTASIIRDLNSAALNTFTPMRILDNNNVQIVLNVPYLVRTVEFVNMSKLGKSAKSLDMGMLPENHLLVKLDGLKLDMQASTCKENVSSSFTKKLSLPKGTDTSRLKYVFDNKLHSLTIEAPLVF